MSERETRRERDFWGNEHDNIYEDGKRVGEHKFEDRGGFLGFGKERHKVEYDSEHDEVGYSRQERRGGFLGFGGEDVEADYDRQGARTGYSRVEERGGFLGFGGRHERIGYDEDDNEVSSTAWERRGGFLGFGESRARVTRYAGDSARSNSSSGILSSAGSSSLEEGLIKLVIGLAIVFFVVWLVFAVLLPLAIVNTAVLALIGAAGATRRRRLFLIVSTIGAAYVVLDYNGNGLTHGLVKTLPFLMGWMGVFVCANMVAGLVSLYPLLLPAVFRQFPTNDGQRSQQHLYLAGGLAFVACAGIGAQGYADWQWQQNHPAVAVAPAVADPAKLTNAASPVTPALSVPNVARAAPVAPSSSSPPASTPTAAVSADTSVALRPIGHRALAGDPDLASRRSERAPSVPAAPPKIACVMPDGHEERLTVANCESAGGMEYK